MDKRITVREIVELVNDIDSEDPIDWDMLSINESQATELIVSSLIDQYYGSWSALDRNDQSRAMIAVMAKLIIENFVLTLKIYK